MAWEGKTSRAEQTQRAEHIEDAELWIRDPKDPGNATLRHFVQHRISHLQGNAVPAAETSILLRCVKGNQQPKELWLINPALAIFSSP
jgi:hypothetical protein